MAMSKVDKAVKFEGIWSLWNLIWGVATEYGIKAAVLAMLSAIGLGLYSAGSFINSFGMAGWVVSGFAAVIAVAFVVGSIAWAYRQWVGAKNAAPGAVPENTLPRERSQTQAIAVEIAPILKALQVAISLEDRFRETRNAVDGIVEQQKAINTTMVNLVKENDAKLDKVQEQIKSVAIHLEKQIGLVSDRGHAQRAVYELHQYRRDIERLAQLLERPIKQGTGDWSGWDKRFQKFRVALLNYMGIAEAYFPNDVPNVRTIPPEIYRNDTGDFARDKFPDHQTAHDFKTFRYLSAIYESVGADYLRLVQSKVYG